MQQLSGVDSSFLAFEGATTVGHITGVVLLDPTTSPVPWTFERFAAHMESRLHLLAPMRKKLFEVPLGLDRPYWVDDPDFDLDYHLRYVAVPGGGGRTEFANLVSRIHERPLDRRRPLWECYVVDGVHGDDKALIAKIHHAAIDGLSGQEILASLVDLEPLAGPDPDSSTQSDGDEAGANGRGDDIHDDIAGESLPATSDLMSRAALSLLTSPARMARAGMTLAKAMPVLGAGLGRTGPVSRGDESTRELVRRFGAAPKTPFNATIGPHRRWAYVSIPLDDVKAVKNKANATVNDAVLAIVSGVLRSWLQDQDALPDRPLATMVPLSVRKPGDGAAVGNMVSSTVSTLATHLDDPAERLAAIKASMDKAKEQHEALPADILTDLTQVAPPALAALAARLVASTRLADRMTLPFNLVVSNVPGPPIPIYMAGALITGNYPVSAIVDGVGLNITVQSTNGMLDFGYVSDRELIPDLWDLADRTAPALKDLADAVGAEISL